MRRESLTVVVALALLAGCSKPVTNGATDMAQAADLAQAADMTADGGGAGAFVEGLGLVPAKLDLVLMVANGRSMSPLQPDLPLLAPDLLGGLLNPACVDDTGAAVAAAMQPGPTGSCPAGTVRRFQPIADAHVGLLSSSLGSFGADSCPDVSPACPNPPRPTTTTDTW